VNRKAAGCHPWRPTDTSPGSWNEEEDVHTQDDLRTARNWCGGQAGAQECLAVCLVPHLCPLKTFPFSRSVWKVWSLWTGCRKQGRKGERGLNPGRLKPAGSSPCLEGAEETQGTQALPRPGRSRQPHRRGGDSGSRCHATSSTQQICSLTRSPKHRGQPGRWIRPCHRRTCGTRRGQESQP